MAVSMADSIRGDFSAICKEIGRAVENHHRFLQGIHQSAAFYFPQAQSKEGESLIPQGGFAARPPHRLNGTLRRHPASA